MRLLQAQPQQLLDQGREADARIAEQPPGHLGVEDGARPVTEIGQARQVLRRRVQDSLGVRQGGVEAGQVRAGDRIDQHRARAVAA
jgi:hypothetical protein